jgi:hypothetical protein
VSSAADAGAQEAAGGDGALDATSEAGDASVAPGCSAQRQPGGSSFTVYLPAATGRVAVRISVPATPRYADGAPVVVLVATFFTQRSGYTIDPKATSIGAIGVSYLWPGEKDAQSGDQSEGTFDYGGPTSIAALAQVVRYATGAGVDLDGCRFDERIAIPALVSNTGLYAFSHPGIAATAVMAMHGETFPSLAWFVGRENPTVDAVSAVELGHWQGTKAVLNPAAYTYPDDYGAEALQIDYTGIGWTATADPDCVQKGYGAVPVFAPPSGPAYVTGCRVPTMWGKRYYSIALTTALRDSGAFGAGSWPADLATVAEAEAEWPFRVSPPYFPLVGQKLPKLRAMLVFARNDHVQVLADKPHVHQAWDGLRAGGLWVRLNPDRAYASWANPAFGAEFPDQPANAAPASWADMTAHAYPNVQTAAQLVPLAALAEMLDRTHESVWVQDLAAVLVNTPPPIP